MCAGDSLAGIGDRMDVHEVCLSPGGELFRGQRARVAGARRDEGAARPAETFEQLVDAFLAQDRDAEDVVAGRDSRQQPVDSFWRVRAVADLVVAPFEAAGERDVGAVLDLSPK